MHSIKEGITWKYAIRSSRAIIQTMQIQMLLLLEITRYYLEVSVLLTKGSFWQFLYVIIHVQNN